MRADGQEPARRRLRRRAPRGARDGSFVGPLVVARRSPRSIARERPKFNFPCVKGVASAFSRRSGAVSAIAGGSLPRRRCSASAASSNRSRSRSSRCLIAVGRSLGSTYCRAVPGATAGEGGRGSFGGDDGTRADAIENRSGVVDRRRPMGNYSKVGGTQQRVRRRNILSGTGGDSRATEPVRPCPREQLRARLPQSYWSRRLIRINARLQDSAAKLNQ